MRLTDETISTVRMMRTPPQRPYIPRVTQRRALGPARWVDVVPVLLVAGTAVEVLVRPDLKLRTDYPLVAVAVVLALVVLPLTAQRAFPFLAPVMVWLLADGVSLAYPGIVTATFGCYLGGMISAFLLGHLSDAGRARAGLVVVVASAAFLMTNDPAATPSSLVVLPGFFAMVWLTGLTLRSRSDRAEAAEERARTAERERESAARVAVAEERARIARELHDVVAHSVSVMVLQVGAVRHRMPTDREVDRQALQDVEHVGRAALGEVRRLLGALAGESDAELAPQPGLDQLEALVDKVRGTGLEVVVHVQGEAVELPRAVDLSAYRIIQEGLTNVLKHAAARCADVTVTYGRDDLTVQVRDDGTGPASGDRPGRGLVGVGERVKIYGGSMNAGPAPGGGFLLTARLSVDGVGA